MPTELLSRESIVYSGGVGEDVSFDLALIQRVGCDVWAFDPTPRAIAFAADLDAPNLHFLPYALWSTNEVKSFFVPRDGRHVSHSLVNLQHTDEYIDVRCRSIPSIMSELGHERIDLLKLDIEGAEYDVLRALGDVRPRILCVEFHLATNVSRIIAFVRSLPYEPIRVDRWNVTLLSRETGAY